MIMNKKLLNLILKEPYYNTYYNNMKKKDLKELLKILENTLKVNVLIENNLLENEILNELKENEKINYEKKNELYNLFERNNNKGLFILKYLILEKI